MLLLLLLPLETYYSQLLLGNTLFLRKQHKFTTAERNPAPDRRNNNTRVHLVNKSLLPDFLTGIWVRGCLQERNDSKSALSPKPTLVGLMAYQIWKPEPNCAVHRQESRLQSFQKISSSEPLPGSSPSLCSIWTVPLVPSRLLCWSETDSQLSLLFIYSWDTETIESNQFGALLEVTHNWLLLLTELFCWTECFNHRGHC